MGKICAQKVGDKTTRHLNANYHNLMHGFRVPIILYWCEALIKEPEIRITFVKINETQAKYAC